LPVKCIECSDRKAHITYVYTTKGSDGKVSAIAVMHTLAKNVQRKSQTL